MTLDREGTPLSILWATKDRTENMVHTAGAAIAYDMMGAIAWSVSGPSDLSAPLSPDEGPLYVLGSEITVT